jgi:hypothetical protein
MNPFLNSPYMKRLTALARIRPEDTRITYQDFLEVMAMTATADNQKLHDVYAPHLDLIIKALERRVNM